MSARPMFRTDSVIRRVSMEPALLFGAGRALLLQLAHPAVAQGVEDHSDFKGNPFARLEATLEATYAVVFGSEDLADGVGRRIRWVHDFVRGPGYAANDPTNLMWVHATLLDTALHCYSTLIAPLSADDERNYYEEMARVAEVFGVARGDQLATIADFRAYMDDTVATMDVTAVGRDLAGFILQPSLPLRLHLPLSPLLSLQRRFTLGTIPDRIREQMSVRWTAQDQSAFERSQRRIRRAMRTTPRAVRTAPTRAATRAFVWQAERRVRAFDERRRAAGTAGATAA